MFYNDHAPPHFHARYAEFEVTIDIETFAIIRGELPRRELELAQEWAMIHREELIENWRWCRENLPPEKVRFEDGLSGRVRLREDDLTGVLVPLRDPQFFKQVFIEYGAVAWPGEIDLAPDAMYESIARELK
jgi:hypothetical protein